jgi:predicted nuclease of predicted toxin-antitoxin system
MKFLVDQDVYAITVDHLRRLGHDVITVSKLGLEREDDAKLLRTAHNDSRIFVTRDRHFGGLVFVEGLHGGVIYLRILPSTQDSVHAELTRVLTLYSENELASAFVVIEPGGHRIRRTSSGPQAP